MEEQLEITLKRFNLPFRSGPVTSGLDEALKEQSIHTQAHNGRSFVGNYCHKYLKAYDHICDSVDREKKRQLMIVNAVLWQMNWADF